MFEVTSNVFVLGFVDLLISAASLAAGYGLGRIGIAKLQADVDTIKAIIFPTTTVTVTPPVVVTTPVVTPTV